METNDQILSVIYTLCIFLGLLTMYMGFLKIFKIKKSKFLSIILIFIVSTIISFSIHFIPNLPATYVLAFFMITMVFGFSFNFTMNQCFFIGCYYVFHVIAFKGIVLGVISLIFKINTFMVLNDTTYNMFSIIFTQLLLFVTFLVYIKFIEIQKIRGFLINRKQLVHVLGCHISILLFMIFNTFTYYYNLDLIWISIAQILISIILYIIYMVVLNYGTHMSNLLQHKMRDQKQLETIQAQLRQQNSLLKITETVNMFKHDYREQLLTIEECIETEQYNKAIKEIKKDCLYHLDKLPHTKKFSNNIIINSLLLDRQEICDEKDIEMEALLFYPQDLSINERELHELLRIISDNAIEANERIKNRKRYIKLKSTLENKWLDIQIENPYEGIILFEEERPVSSYEREDNEGMGLIYVEELLEDRGGIIRYDNDDKNKVFREHILIRIEN